MIGACSKISRFRRIVLCLMGCMLEPVVILRTRNCNRLVSAVAATGARTHFNNSLNSALLNFIIVFTFNLNFTGIFESDCRSLDDVIKAYLAYWLRLIPARHEGFLTGTRFTYNKPTSPAVIRTIQKTKLMSTPLTRFDEL